MQQFDQTRTVDIPAPRAPAGRRADARRPHDARAFDRATQLGHMSAEARNPCEILQRLAQAIHLMRLDHVDAHLYRNGCDALVQQAVGASKWSGLSPALKQIMRFVEQGDYHWALMELRTISQPEWHTC